ncbi:hypothetical protein NMY22_g9130 [Coprinellus aureogranulatus]|nr:hypothetical protein NMY22_g9130 [Coprinellus aureogranulatus]
MVLRRRPSQQRASLAFSSFYHLRDSLVPASVKRGGAMELNFNFKLSSDLLVHILQCLDPIDILAMRATCRMFYRAAASRSVWLAALDRVCEQHGIYKPTYPLEKMTLAELEHAASGPHRFIKFVDATDSTQPGHQTQPYLIRQIPYRKKAEEAGSPDESYAATRLVLIPGGRFLVTSASSDGTTEKGAVCLWDLGYSMHTPAKPFPVASTSTEPSILSLSACPGLDGKAIIVAILGQSLGNEWNQICIFSVNPLSQTPEFVLRHTQVVPFARSQLSALDEPIAVAKTGRFLSVYNWVEKTGCRWARPSPPPNYRTHSVHLYGDAVISMDGEDDFVVWHIPQELPPLSPGAEPPIVPNPPYARPPATYDPPHLCYTTDSDDPEDGSRKVILYSLRKMGGRDRAFVPCYLPVVGGVALALNGVDGEATSNPVSPLFLCDGQLVFCSVTGTNGLVATVFPIPTRASEDAFEPRWATLVEGSEDDDEINMDSKVEVPLKLPPDLIQLILQLLDPVDILAMRATCRIIYQVAASRSVWLRALNRVCEQHGIYKPTYPMRTMSLSELEYAASRPHRFIKFVMEFDSNACASSVSSLEDSSSHSAAEESSSSPHLTRQFLCRKEPKEEGQPDSLYHILKLVLVPGGRFVVTCTNAKPRETSGVVCLWDLGYSMLSPVEPHLVATTIAQSEIEELTACPSEDGKDIILAICGFSRLSKKNELNIFTIDPGCRNPKFVLRGGCYTCPFNSNPHLYLDEPRVALMTSHSISLYNWVEGIGFQWRCSELNLESGVILYDHTVVALSVDSDFLIWDISKQLSPPVQGGELQEIANPPERCQRLHKQDPEDMSLSEIAFTPSCQRHGSSSSRLYFIIDEMSERGRDCRLYGLQKTGDSHVAVAPSSLPRVPIEGQSVSLEDEDGEQPDMTFSSPLFLCDGRLVVCGHSYEDGLMVMITDHHACSAAPDNSVSTRRATLLHGVKGDAVSSSKIGFCPMSGRLVRRLSPTSLEISDFGSPQNGRQVLSRIGFPS